MSTKRVAIVQSNYIPWKGYFDLIRSVDEFVLFDDVQYTRRDWRNRNRIKAPAGPIWLTIPVNAKGNHLAPINRITVSDRSWARRHWRSLVAHYRRAAHFETYRQPFEALYAECGDETYLSAINYKMISKVCELLGIRTKLSWSTDFPIVQGRTERLVGICAHAGAGTYVSGPSARGYIDPACFAAAGIDLVYFDYSGYAEYEQLHPPFDHHVSILDLLFSQGPDAPRYMLTR
jgi:WbqC-like protein family